MKKAVSLLLMVLLLALSSGCGAHKNTITTVTDLGRAQAVISAACETAFLFDFDVGDSYNWITVSADEYRLGQKTEPYKLSCGVSGKGSILIFTTKADDAEVPQKLVLNVSGGGALASSSAAFDAKFDSPGNVGRATEVDPGSTIPASGSKVLGYIQYSTNGVLFPLTPEFFDNYPDTLAEFKRDNLYYVFRCEFTKEPKH